MEKKYTVIRTDLLSGTKQPADLLSVRFYKSSNPVEVENGVIAKVGDLIEGEREVYKVEAATSVTPLNECVIIAGVEVMYDEHKRNLDEYINAAGKTVRGYIPRSRNKFALTKEGFQGGTAPELKQTVGIGTDGKLNAGGTGFGKCIAIETAGKYTYYVIEIGVTEASK